MKRAGILGVMAATSIVSVIGGAATVSALTPGQATVAAQPRVIHRAAIVMLGSKVRIHKNSAHTSLGSPRVALTPGRGRKRCHLTVTFDQNPGERIIHIDADPDDKMAAAGMTVGTAGGNARVFLRFYRGTSKKGKPIPICANDKSINPATNVWLATEVLAAPLPPA